MKILGLDSSGLVASAAVVEDDVLLGEYTTDYRKTHSQTLLPMLDELRRMLELDLNSLDAIAIAAGPGSFTGLRIGSATAKGLGLALKKPIVEVPTLEGLAWNLWGTDRLVCPLMDARRNQVYGAAYEFCPASGPEIQSRGQSGDRDTDRCRGMEPCQDADRCREMELRPVIPQAPVGIGELLEKINALGRETVFLGDGVAVYRETIRERCRVPYSLAPAGRNRQRAANVAALGEVYLRRGKAVVTAAEHQPVYLRLSQAERERREKEEGTPLSICIRRLREEDVEPLCRIEGQQFSMPWSAEDFRRLIGRENCLYLVAETQGRTVGCCGMTYGFGEGNIDNVVVDGEFQNKGIAQRLLRELFSQGAEAGVNAYTLEVRVSNAAAIHVYEKLGFVSEGVRPRFYEKPVEDALIMWRR